MIDEGQLFDADYLHFYREYGHDPALCDAESDLIATLLDLTPGQRVLDLGCGHGRIANRLAAEGARVVGLDCTPMFLERAREDASERGVDVDYVLGDMRALDYEDEFDAVVSWFTAFGYHDDETLRDILRGVYRSLTSGGALLLETLNRDTGRVEMLEAPTVQEIDGELMVDLSRFDPFDGRLYVRRFIAREGRPMRRLEYFMRLFPFTELRDWLLATGFENIFAFGGEGEIFTPQSERLIVVAHKP